MFCVSVNPDHFLHSPEEGRKVSKVRLRPLCAVGAGGKSPDTPSGHALHTHVPVELTKGLSWWWCFSTPRCLIKSHEPQFDIQCYVSGVTGECKL